MAGKNLKLAKKLNILAWIITIIVMALVSLMRRVEKIDLGLDLSYLPGVHALLNTGAALALIFAYYFIRKKDILNHKKSIYAAILLSCLFLLSYVLYHFTHEEISFGGEGWLRTIYLLLLISHILLAALTFPFILFTFVRAYTNQIEKHKKLAKWIYPFWLYVTISGPICYLMLRPYY